MGSSYRWLATPLSLVLASISTLASAEPLPSVDVRQFQPSTSPEGSLYLEPTMSPGAGEWNVGSFFSWAYRPVVLRDTNGDTAAKLVSHQLSMDVLGSIGITDFGALGLSVPAVLFQQGDTSPQTAAVLGDSSLPGQALGDVALTGKATLVPYEMAGFGLAALARVSAPTGSRTAYVGEGALTSELRVLAEYSLIAVTAQATAGFKLRTQQRTFAGETWGNEIPWGLGLSVLPQALGWDSQGRWRWVLEAHGALPAGPTKPFSSHPLSPALIGASARYEVARNVFLTTGVEGPLDGAVGVPLTRIVAGLSWAPRFHDMDGDGIPDHLDQCPELAEDMDGFEDDDGCPDFDNDSDGVPDHLDQCPFEEEDLDDFQDDDGCPDPDNDRDGILDVDDACPDVWGVASEDPSKHGCPILDRDGDGILDAVDKCPDEPEDMDGFEDDDGCPDLDNDGDGIPDLEDRCPNTPGPSSANPKWHGCPVPDQDGDTFDDEQDKCPTEPETWNDFQDDDGCPDTGGMWLVRETTSPAGPAIQIRKPLRFDGPLGAQTVHPDSVSTVRAIATILNQRPDWVLAVGSRPNPADGTLASSHALSRAFALVLALRSYTYRDGVAETVGWEAVQDQPSARAHGTGFLVLDGAPDPSDPPEPSEHVD